VLSAVLGRIGRQYPGTCGLSAVLGGIGLQ
jgi:hypothetical protein